LDASDTPTRLIESQRHSVKRVLKAIVTRYAIDSPTDAPFSS
jgi:hypothetical protein